MRTLSASLILAMLGLGLVTCGGTNKGPFRASQASSSVVARSEASTVTTASHSTSGKNYLNDGDKDPSSDEDFDDLNGKTIDEDNDPREDHVLTQNHSYHDSDDRDIVSFGHRPRPAEERAVTIFAERYLAAAVSGDGTTACSLMYSTFAKAVPEDYGRPPSSPAWRGKTCPAVMSKLFTHTHGELTHAFEVTGVRVVGSRGIALLGSRTMPASHLDMRRERDVWRVAALGAVPLA